MLSTITPQNYLLKKWLFLLLIIIISASGFSQNGVAINTTGTSANSSAMLDVSSTTAGMLIPRMTSVQKAAIISPANGLLVYQTDGAKGFYYFDGTAWTQLSTTTLGQSAITAYGDNSLSVTPATTTFTLVPGLTNTILVPSNSVVVINTDGGIQTTSVTSTGFSVIDIAIFIDGSLLTNGGYQRITALNGGVVNNSAFWSQTVSASLAAGSHTITVRALYNLGSNATVGGNNTTVLQPELTVSILKL